MAREIHWDNKFIEIISDKNRELRESWIWTKVGAGSYIVTINGQNHPVSFVDVDEDCKMVVRISGVEREVQILDERALLLKKIGVSAGESVKNLDLRAPMPGKVLTILVKPGDIVQKGDSLVILEAMKMENIIKSSASATVESVPANSDSAVEKGEVLVKFTQE